MAPDQILKFWLDETAPEKWYSVDLDLDAEIKHRFEPVVDISERGFGLYHSRRSIFAQYVSWSR